MMNRRRDVVSDASSSLVQTDKSQESDSTYLYVAYGIAQESQL